MTTKKCACGCDEMATTRVHLLREQDRETARQLRWAAASTDPMRWAVPVVDGHEEDGIDGYVSLADEVAGRAALRG